MVAATTRSICTPGLDPAPQAVVEGSVFPQSILAAILVSDAEFTATAHAAVVRLAPAQHAVSSVLAGVAESAVGVPS